MKTLLKQCGMILLEFVMFVVLLYISLEYIIPFIEMW